ncbi:MAG: lytic transglycosylase domain-containing protein [Pseudomonadota bacterium]|nr:lytic transglycosylase domain-containing protein [Pseudomonadota bacterium]
MPTVFLQKAVARLHLPVLGLALLLLHGAARADLWAYMDEAGVTHFAASQVDARYQLFYKGNDVARLDLGAHPLRPTPLKGSLSSAKPGAARPPGYTVPKRFSGISQSRGYRAVQPHMRAAAKAHAVDYELLKAVIAAESGFDPQAVSPKGAVGLMQLMPATAGQYGVVADAPGRTDRQGRALPARSVQEKLTDPRTNIFAGARHLAYLLKRFNGNTELAVAAYNAGEGAVQRAGQQIPNYRETRGYVSTVMGLYGAFKPEPASVPAPALARAPATTTAIAPIVSRVPGSRVRVELGGPAAKLAPAAEHQARSRVGGPLVPVLSTVPLTSPRPADET